MEKIYVITKDSGKRDVFPTGAQRDTSENKPRFDLIPLASLDLLQEFFGGAPLHIDSSEPRMVGFLPGAETRVDLIPQIMLNRLGGLYYRGAEKYGDNNWQKGIPLSRIYESLFRHMIQWYAGDTSEDHIAAVIWNATAIMWTENAVAYGDLPEGLTDLPLTNS